MSDPAETISIEARSALRMEIEFSRRGVCIAAARAKETDE